MGFLGLLFQFSLECFDILAWPLIALGYPLCASIQAVETDSKSDTQKLVTYWICFSLILLFEHAFLKLLLWLPYWSYVKLAVVGCLVTPHFDGSFYVYKHFVHPCLSMDWFVELREYFKNHALLFDVNRDAKETGSESSENRVSFETQFVEPELVQKDKNSVEITEREGLTSTDWPEFVEPELVEKDNNAVEITQEKRMTSTNQPEFVECEVVQKDNNALEITEEKRLTSTIHVGQVKLAIPENRTYEALDIKEITAASVTSRDVPEVPASKNIQKEWTCALCQVTASCEANLISHLNGRKHKNAGMKLNATNQTSRSKILEALKSPKKKEIANTKVEGKDISVNSHFKSTLNPWTCALCQVTALSKRNIVFHFIGNRHELALEKLENKEETALAAAASLVNIENPWTCGLCSVKISNVTTLISHLKGQQHKRLVRHLRQVAKTEMLKQ